LNENEGSVMQVNAGVEPTLAPIQNPETASDLLGGEFTPVTEVPSIFDEDGRSKDSLTEEGLNSTKSSTEDPEPTGASETTATPVPEAVDTEAEPVDLKMYIVQKGDTLAGICRDFYGSLVRMEEIKGINQITDEDWIYAGQELYLP